MNLKALSRILLPYRARFFIKTVFVQIYKIKNGLKNVNTNFDLTIIGDDVSNTFFGYYDISPFNEKDELVYLEVLDGKNYANIVWNNSNGKDKKIVAKTNAWNTQQGARLRWFPNSNAEICFNDFVDGKYVNRKINLETYRESLIDSAIYDISSDGRYGVTLDFERLGVLRPGYGYTNDNYCAKLDLSEEGISIVDMNTGHSKKVVTYKDITNALGQEIDDYSQYYINHLSFSPNGEKFLFFWLKNINNWAEASLLTYEIKTSRIVVLENEMRVSHYTWLDNETILCTAIKGSSVYNMECRYYVYREGFPRQIVGKDILQRDGHPTLYKNHIILTDTYPDNMSFQELFLYDLDNNIKKRLVYSYSVYVRDSVYRTDMHPRFNYNKTKICYDANVNGHRHLYVLNNFDKDHAFN